MTELNVGTASPDTGATDLDAGFDGLASGVALDPDTALIREVVPVSPATIDSDGDGLTDSEEVEFGSDPNRADSDDDGLDDGLEAFRGSDPRRDDTDGDRLDDLQEYSRGTDPNDSDSDDDGLTDGHEVFLGSDPKDTDSNDDGLTDNLVGRVDVAAQVRGVDVAGADSAPDRIPDDDFAQGAPPGSVGVPGFAAVGSEVSVSEGADTADLNFGSGASLARAESTADFEFGRGSAEGPDDASFLRFDPTGAAELPGPPEPDLGETPDLLPEPDSAFVRMGDELDDQFGPEPLLTDADADADVAVDLAN